MVSLHDSAVSLYVSLVSLHVFMVSLHNSRSTLLSVGGEESEPVWICECQTLVHRSWISFQILHFDILWTFTLFKFFLLKLRESAKLALHGSRVNPHGSSVSLHSCIVSIHSSRSLRGSVANPHDVSVVLDLAFHIDADTD
jgi:hypothetical protein